MNCVSAQGHHGHGRLVKGKRSPWGQGPGPSSSELQPSTPRQLKVSRNTDEEGRTGSMEGGRKKEREVHQLCPHWQEPRAF